VGKCDALIREMRFVIEDEVTEVYVRIDAVGDCPLGVQGWHHKTLPAATSALEILSMIASGKLESPTLWPLEAPRG
jgi:hypothetical protein